jgi:hypothetical protein
VTHLRAFWSVFARGSGTKRVGQAQTYRYVVERSGAPECVTPPIHRFIQLRIASFGYVMRTKSGPVVRG